MHVTHQVTKDKWEALVATHNQASFLQAWAWGEFQAAAGRPVYRLAVTDERGQYLAAAQFFFHPLPFGQRYLYLPRGPVWSANLLASNKKEATRLLADHWLALAKEKRAMFLRFEPLTFDDHQEWLSLGYHLKRVADVQPSRTRLLDLSISEDELLKNFHQKTRYNIKLAAKKGVGVELTTDPQALTDFFQLLNQTAKRDGFQPHPESYYQKMWHSLSVDGKIKIARARYQNRTLVSNLIIVYGDTVTYLHGASSDQDRQLMAPHLTQWETIKYAKKLGYKYYDFWGVASADKPRHHLAGVTRFKAGFDGHEVVYLGTFELALKSVTYLGYLFFRKLRR